MPKSYHDSSHLYSNPKTCRRHESFSSCQQIYLLNGTYRCKIDDQDCIFKGNKLKCDKLEKYLINSYREENLKKKRSDNMRERRTISQISKNVSSKALKQHHMNRNGQYKNILENHCKNIGNKNTKDFYMGVLHTLSIVAVYNNEDLFKTIVNNTDVNQLVAAAKEESAMEWSGLRKYGYE